jgi:hypothetical protein
MSKRVFITLLQTCMIAGLPRSPAEGVQEVPVDEAKRLIDANMAELADMDGAGEDGDDDGLEKMKVPELKKLAEAEQVEFGSGTSKADLIAAIRGSRDRADAKAALAEFDRDKLIEIAKTEEVEVADDATDDQIREAIFVKTFPPAA